MPAELTLERLQRWMQAVIVHPGAAEEALSSPAAAAEVPPAALGDVLLPSRSLEPSERIAIYHGMYLFRMEEALAVDYPGLKHFLGDGPFFDLVRDYVQAYPSRSYTLNRLGDHLPDFVESAEGLKRRDFCADLARLELAVTETFDAEETPPLASEAVTQVPPDAWERAVLEPIAALRLVALRYNANAYLDSLKGDAHQHPRPKRQPACVVVFRSDYAVYRLDLTPVQHALLSELVAGVPLGVALESSLKRRGRVQPKEDDLFRWFRQWVGHGLFRSVRTP